jgi:Flp pilus assembly protein TadG
MKKLIRKTLADENGAVIVAVAAFMVCGLLLGALSVDFGCAYVRGAEVQTAADAAVLAAGRQLPVALGDTAAQRDILRTRRRIYAKERGRRPHDYTITLCGLENSQYRSLNISASGSVPTSFAGVIGIHKLSFTKTAEVQVAVCVRTNDVVPLSVEKETLDACVESGNTEHITLKFGAKDKGDLPGGDFGAIDLDGVMGGGANDYEYWLMYGYTGEISVGDDLYPVESGNMAGPTAVSFNARYNACTHFPGEVRLHGRLM